MAHAVGAQIFVDAVHYAPHELVDVRAMDCDFLSCSAYKFYGPHIGVLYGRADVLASLDFPKLIPAPDSAPERAETGTQNHEGIAGAAAAVDFLASLSAAGTRCERLSATFAGLHERGAAFVRQLWRGLGEIDGVKIYGPSPTEPRTPTIGFTIAGHSSSTEVARVWRTMRSLFPMATFMRRRLSSVWVAHEGLVRAGCACYTTREGSGAADRWSPRHHACDLIPRGPISDRSRPIFAQGPC